jgi:hypothetical protein
MRATSSQSVADVPPLAKVKMMSMSIHNTTAYQRPATARSKTNAYLMNVIIKETICGHQARRASRIHNGRFSGLVYKINASTSRLSPRTSKIWLKPFLYTPKCLSRSAICASGKTWGHHRRQTSPSAQN